VRFNEIWRDEPFGGEWRELRRAYVSGADHADWEPREEVADRLGAGIIVRLSQAADRLVVGGESRYGDHSLAERTHRPW
jgi:hypothetical protein